MKFQAGEIVLIQGPSGKGKSTLASIMAGHVKDFSGEIFLQGKKYSGPNREVLVVHQESDLFPWLSVNENLKILKKINLTDQENFIEELKVFGLLEAADLYPSQLSGGMKRRLAILRGLIMTPKVLILDESMSSLDERLKKEIMNVLKTYSVKNAMTIIIIDHNAEALNAFIDRSIEL
jgi:NitT/TauT family transport system ATP-binding protein